MIFRAVLMTAHYRKVTAAINNSLGQKQAQDIQQATGSEEQAGMQWLLLTT